MNDLIVIKVDEIQLKKMKEFYREYLKENSNEYVYFMAKVNDVVIIGYSSTHQNKKVTFKGKHSLEEAKLWDKNASFLENKIKEKEHFLDFNDQIGSDEVGVGDLFLPMIVVASYLNSSDMEDFFNYGVHDCKKMSDDYIRKIGPKIVKRFAFSKLTLTNEKYNELIEKGENINSLKAKMHNRALLNMKRKYPDVDGIYVDQFVSPKCYYEYLKKTDEIIEDICFETKGELKFPCVALASVIARYAFLLEKDKLDQKYHTSFPFGASQKVDDFLSSFLKNHSLDETKKLVKTNFKNFSKYQK